MPLRVPSSSGIGLEPRARAGRAPRLEDVELVLGRVDEQRLREQRVVRHVGDDAHARSGAPDRRRRTRRRRRAPDAARGRRRPCRVARGTSPRGLTVHVVPPDALSEPRSPHDELVTSGERPVWIPVSTTSGLALGEHAFVGDERVRVEHRDQSDFDRSSPFGLSPCSTAPRSRCAQPWPPSLLIVFTASTEMHAILRHPLPFTDGARHAPPRGMTTTPKRFVRRINDPTSRSFLDLVPQPYTARRRTRLVRHRATEGWRARNVGDVRDPRRRVDGAVGGVGIRFLDRSTEGCGEIGLLGRSRRAARQRR